jgi:hypothetical protein
MHMQVQYERAEPRVTDALSISTFMVHGQVRLQVEPGVAVVRPGSELRFVATLPAGNMHIEIEPKDVMRWRRVTGTDPAVIKVGNEAPATIPISHAVGASCEYAVYLCQGDHVIAERDPEIFICE